MSRILWESDSLILSAHHDGFQLTRKYPTGTPVGSYFWQHEYIQLDAAELPGLTAALVAAAVKPSSVWCPRVARR